MHRHTVPLRVRLAGVVPGVPGAVVVSAPGAVGVSAPPTQYDAHDPTALHELRDALARIDSELQARRQHVSRELALLSVELGIVVAEHLLKTAIEADRQRLDRIVEHALGRIAPQQPAKVRAHPDDLALLERQLRENDDLQQANALLTLQRDDSLPRGRLRLEADDGFVDWDTSRSLAELRDLLLEETQTEQ